MAAQISTGITIAFATSGYADELLDVTPPGLTRESVNASHMGTTGAHRKIPVDLYDSGELGFQVHFDPDTNPPIDGAAEIITMTFPSGTTWTFTGFMKGYEPSAPFEDKMVADVKIEVDGTIVIDPLGGGSACGSGSFEV